MLWVWRYGDADVLGLGEEAQRFLASLAADAALLHSAERRPEVAQHPAVDPDDAGGDPVGHAVRPAEIAGPERRGQAVVGAVGQADDLVLGGERRDGDDRPENLLAIQAMFGGQAG